MKDAYEVLHEKETDLARVRKEVESLNIVARLLTEHDDGKASDDLTESSDESSKRTSSSLSETISRLADAAATSAENLFPSIATSRPKFWNPLKRAT
jgi:hypothetical protein